jgi:hypothetical protein
MAARPFAEHLRGFAASADPFAAITHVFCLSRTTHGKELDYLYSIFGGNATESGGLPVSVHLWEEMVKEMRKNRPKERRQIGCN